MFVGHGTLRNQAGIGRSDSPEPEAMQHMLNSLDASLAYTFGLSTGLEYNPGLNASTDADRSLTLPELDAITLLGTNVFFLQPTPGRSFSRSSSRRAGVMPSST